MKTGGNCSKIINLADQLNKKEFSNEVEQVLNYSYKTTTIPIPLLFLDNGMNFFKTVKNDNSFTSKNLKKERESPSREVEIIWF